MVSVSGIWSGDLICIFLILNGDDSADRGEEGYTLRKSLH